MSTPILGSVGALPVVSRSRGFTLLELMATVAVAAVIMTVAVPSFAALVRDNRVVAQTNALVTTLNLARAEAVKRGRRVRVEVDSAGTGWAATVTVVGVVGDPLRVVDQSNGRVTINEASVEFEATGALAASETFDLQPHADCSGTQRRQVTVTVAGQITTARLPCA